MRHVHMSQPPGCRRVSTSCEKNPRLDTLMLALVLCCSVACAAVGDTFTVSNTDFGLGGTAGTRTIEITGLGFDRSVTAELSNSSGFVYSASQYYRPDPNVLYATFDLTHVSPGDYDVLISKQTTSESIRIYRALNVVSGGGGTNQPQLAETPAVINRQAGQIYSFTVQWENIGINDSLSPLLEVRTNEPFGDDPNELADKRGLYSEVFYGVPSGKGPRGILCPGQSGARTFYINPQPLSDGTWRHVNYSVDRLYKDLDAPFDWESIRADVQPWDMADSGFESLFQQTTVQVGQTCGDFLEMLSRNASLLNEREDGTLHWEDCVSLELAFMQASLDTSISGRLQNPDFAVEIGNVDITARNADTGTVYATTTLVDGTFVLPVEAGNYLFSSMDAAISQSDSLAIDLGDTSTIVLPVTVGGQLHGKVLREDGSIGADIDVLVAEPTATDPVYRHARTDETGTYCISHLPAGEYSVGMKPTELGWSPMQAVTVSNDSLVQVDLSLHRTEVLSINVVRRISDEPVENAWITVASSGTGIHLSGYTDSQGRFQLYLPTGQYAYEVTAEDLVSVGDVIDVLDSAQNAVSVSLDEYGSLTGTITDDLAGLIDDIIAVETHDGGYYIASLDGLSYRIDALEPGTYEVLAIGQDAILNRFEMVVFAGQVAQAPVLSEQGLHSDYEQLTTSAEAVILSIQAEDPREISLWEAYNLLSRIDELVAKALSATDNMESLGSPPSSLFGYPDLELRPAQDMEDMFLKLCSDRRSHVVDLLGLNRRIGDLLGSLPEDIGLLVIYQQGSLIVRVLEWLDRLQKLCPDPSDTPLGKAITKSLPKLFKLRDALCAIGAASRVHATTVQIEELVKEYNEITQPYNKELAQYESWAKEERQAIDWDARDRINEILSYPAGGYSFTATIPGLILDETDIPLGDIGVLSVAQGGGLTSYSLWEISIEVLLSDTGQYVEHWIEVFDTGECAEVSHGYRLRVDGVLKECRLCDGLTETQEVGFTGPERVIPVSIQLCVDDPIGGGTIPGGDDDDDDSDDSDTSSDDAAPCPGGQVRDPITGECPEEPNCPEGYFQNPYADTGMDGCISCQEVIEQYCGLFSQYRAAILPFIGRDDLTFEEIEILFKLQTDVNDDIIEFTNLMLAGNCGGSLEETMTLVMQILSDCLGWIP